MAKRMHRVEQHRSRLRGIEALTLFSNHAFPRHSHDQFGIGIMTFGAQRSWSVIGQVESEVGDVIMVNPGEMHDGLPVDGLARGWRILYLNPTLVAREIAEEEANVVRPVARDPQLARDVDRLFSLVTGWMVLRRKRASRVASCASCTNIRRADHALSALLPRS
jgi:AraC-like ligand binding domain